MSSAISHWIEAMRLRTLPAGIVPVLTGSSLAYHDSVLNPVASSVALICALLIQIATNFANDYFDHVKGADTEERVGFVRASSAGLIPPQAMFNAAVFTFGLAFLLGLYLVWIGGWVILAIGIAGIISGFAYTGGPYPLAYNGWGDVFVFIFFGIIAVSGTYYVNARSWSADALLLSLVIGALCTNILVVNNLRDVETDAKSNKRTLGVIFGETFLKVEYAVLLIVSFIIPVLLWMYGEFSYWILLPLLSLPMAISIYIRIINAEEKSLLNPLLARSAQFMTLFAVLLSAGLIIS